MNRIESQKGQALILIAFGIVALIGFTALAIDGGRVFSDRRNAQNAADTSVLAAALEYIQKNNTGLTSTAQKQKAKDKGLERAESNEYTTDLDSIVTVDFCDEVAGSDPCTGLPAGAITSEYIRVKIISDVKMTFARVLGRDFVTNRVEAIARVQLSPPPPITDFGAGLVSIKHDDSDDCIKINGNANFTVHGAGIKVNCTGDEALFLNGSADVGLEADAQVAGCTNDLGFPISDGGTIECNAPSQTLGESDFDDYPTVHEPTPTCTGNGTKQGNTWQEGNYASLSVGDGDVFAPGTYCISNLNLGNQSVDFSGTGLVQWVLSSSASLAGTADFENLEIYANDANFTVKNSGTLAADRFRFYGIGNSSFVVQGGTMSSDDAYIYSESGEIDINAQADVNLTAPPAGDEFAGTLMYMPWDNPNDFELNGGTNNTWTGLILMPHTDVTYNGGAGFKLYGQVIGYTFKINGGGQSDIFYVAGDPPDAAADPIIELTK